MPTSSVSWTLSDLLKDWVQVQSSDANTIISGLSLDSRSTQPGDLFFAMQGLQSHGLEFSQQAITNGAAGIVWEPNHDAIIADLPASIPCISMPALQQQIASIAQRFYHNPSTRINVIGVTGTDGKTSVCQFIAQAFNQLKLSCGVIGTLGYGIYPDLEPAQHTTPDTIRVQALLSSFVEKQTPYAVIEASSHGLKQGRLNSVAVTTAVFTNLGRDHMDYHASLKDYGDAKRILFQIPNLQNAVINIDDEFGFKLASEISEQVNLVTYSYKDNQPELGCYLYAEKIFSTQGKTKIEINSSWGNTTIETKLLGKFNVSNILAALGALVVSGYSLDKAIKALASVQTVPGRMELVTRVHNAPTVIVDYAHTPQALINALQVLREHCHGKLWCVFGCGGDRDPGKRELMAKAVEEFADIAVVTDDNPRSEDPDVITQGIISGFSLSATYSLIHDRKEAIAYAINSADVQDMVLIAGKGHESVQIINSEHLPFNDKKIAITILENYSP